MRVHWPERYDPVRAKVFVSNEITVPASPEEVWGWLIRAKSWPLWYSNSSDVVLIPADGPDLAPGMRFRWKTFGLTMNSTVAEFQPPTRLAWYAKCAGVDAYHAWVLSPLASGGTHVLTEETQYGWLARLGALLMPNRMQRFHQEWLEALSEGAQSGLPLEPA